MDVSTQVWTSRPTCGRLGARMTISVQGWTSRRTYGRLGVRMDVSASVWTSRYRGGRLDARMVVSVQLWTSRHRGGRLDVRMVVSVQVWTSRSPCGTGPSRTVSTKGPESRSPTQGGRGFVQHNNLNRLAERDSVLGFDEENPSTFPLCHSGTRFHLPSTRSTREASSGKEAVGHVGKTDPRNPEYRKEGRQDEVVTGRRWKRPQWIRTPVTHSLRCPCSTSTPVPGGDSDVKHRREEEVGQEEGRPVSRSMRIDRGFQ